MQCPTVEAVALVLAQGKKILAIFNPGWGAFTLTEWMTVEDFKSREPVTHTARFVLDRLAEKDLLPPWTK